MEPTIDKSQPAIRQEIAERFVAMIPHMQAIGLALVDARGETLHMRLSYREAWLGNTEAGLWHTGIMTTAADSACGAAVFLALPGMEWIATLDLHMEHLRPLVADIDLEIAAHCHHVTHRMAFVTASLHQGDARRPGVRVSATFARTGRSVMP